MVNKCDTCQIRDPRQNVCQLTGQKIDPTKDFCSKHRKTLDRCDVCGKGVLESYLVQDAEEWRLLCGECRAKLNTCAFCRKANKCEFETNPVNLPKMVQKQIRQGPQVMITTIKNPDRIRETCQILCDCFDSEIGCLRDFNYCDKIDHIYNSPNPVKEEECNADANQ
jgi:hypothetical protein